jgi:hypothetical protein
MALANGNERGCSTKLAAALGGRTFLDILLFDSPGNMFSNQFSR